MSATVPVTRSWGAFRAFAASLVIVTLLLSRALWNHNRRLSILRLAIAVALIGIMVSYAAGSSRKMKTTAYILGPVGLVAAYIAAATWITDTEERRSSSETATSPHKDRSQILILATLAATVTYQAGLSPPGGVWRDNGNGHSGGGLILPVTHARQYQVFFFCNSAAFVTSIITIMMVQRMDLVSKDALKAAVILDLFGLIGAYIAGSSRDVVLSSSIYVVLAAVIFVVMVILFVVRYWPSSLTPSVDQQRVQEEKLEKRRKLLLLLATLAVTITYQASRAKPASWQSLRPDNYPRRYKVFFYSNTASFMVSIAIIVILVGRKLSEANRNCWWRLLNASMVVSLIGLAGLLLAYAAGTTRRVKTSIYVLVLVLLVALIQVHYIHRKLVRWFPCLGQPTASAGEANGGQPSASAGEENGGQPTASAGDDGTLQDAQVLDAGRDPGRKAGLDPPGGVWPRDDHGHAAGDPALHNSDRGRYHAFFYTNSTCFVASVVVILLLLYGMLRNSSRLQTLMKVTHAVVVLDLLGLLIAYATGSSRDWHTSGYVLAIWLPASWPMLRSMWLCPTATVLELGWPEPRDRE
ncbi:hypothetical protein EJB05_51163, partial [Eragrostis curvula]